MSSNNRKHDLAYSFEAVLKKHLRARRGLAPLFIDLIPALIDEVPDHAFEPQTIESFGHVMFHDDVEADTVLQMQEALIYSHLNTAPDKRLTVDLCTFGGSLYAGLALVGTIREIQRHGRPVDVQVMGCAMSMGAAILQAGTRRRIEPNGWILLHHGQDAAVGKYHEILEYAQQMQRANVSYWEMFMRRTGKSLEYYEERCHRGLDWYLTADEALHEGLVDEILPYPTL